MATGDVLALPPDDEQRPEIQDDAQSVEMELADEAVPVVEDKSGVVKITNISPGVAVDQMKILFGFLGSIQEMVLYPTDENVPVNSKTCYVKYEDKASCDVAQHLTNTVFVDRPLVVVPIPDGLIPDEGTAMQPRSQQANGLFGNGELDDPFSSDPFTQFMGNVTLGSNLPPPPVLGNIDPVKIEEIRRTVYIGSLDDSVSPEMLVAFFSGVGEIKFVRQSQKEDGQKFALIEFTDLSVITTALQYSGVVFCGKPMKVTYSKCAIIKPDFEKLEAERKNADRHSRYASRRRSSSLQRSGSRSRSREKRRRRSRTRSRSTSYARSRRPRSPSPSYSRSRRRRSRSKSFSRSQRRRSRSRTPSRRRRRSRSPSKSRLEEGIKKKIPDVPRDRRRRRSYSRSPSRDTKYRSSSSRLSRNSRSSRRRTKSRSRSRSGSADKKKSRSKSPVKEKSKKDRSKSRSRSPSRSHAKDYQRRKSSKRDRHSRSRSRSRDRRTRDKDRKRDRRDRSRERSSSKAKKAVSPEKEDTPLYKDVDNVDDNSDMSIEEDYTAKSKDKHDYESDDDRKSKKKSRS